MNLRAPDERAALGDCFDGLSEKVDTGIKKKKEKKRHTPGLCRHFYYTKTPRRCGRDVTQNEIRSFCIVRFIIIIIFFLHLLPMIFITLLIFTGTETDATENITHCFIVCIIVLYKRSYLL